MGYGLWVMGSKKNTAVPSVPCAGGAATRGAVLPDRVPVLRHQENNILGQQNIHFDMVMGYGYGWLWLWFLKRLWLWTVMGYGYDFWNGYG